MGDIFSGAPEIKGIMSVPDKESVITFGGTDKQIGQGFMIQQYNVQWGRPIQSLFPMNVLGRIIIQGFGTGQLVLQGLVGAASDFEALIADVAGTSICKATNCVISANGGFKYCTSNAEDGTDASAIITCSGIILSTVQFSGNRTEGGISMQTANLAFTVSGLKVETKE